MGLNDTRRRGPGRTQAPSRPGVAHAIAYLAGQLSRGTLVAGHRLPPVRRLAAAAEVSYNTMLGAVHALAERGELRTLRGSGVYVRQQLAPAAPQAQGPRWRLVKQAIEQDIVRGVHQYAAMLPSHKELCRRYGADYRTVRKALLSLQSAGYVGKHGRGFVARGYEAGPAGTTVLFLTPYPLSEVGTRSAGGQGLFEFVRVLETECSRRNLRLLPMSTRENETAIIRAIRTHAVLGCVVHEPQPNILRNALTHLDGPVAVFDNIVGFRLSDQEEFAARRNAYCFQPDEYGAGQDVGWYLLRRGYTDAVFLTPAPYPFAQARYHGLADALAAAKGDHAVALRTLGEARARSAALRPLFDAALESPAAAVWVCMNDAVAVEALDFLSHRRIRVPSERAVVGFDNSPAASYRRLTSYDIGFEGIARSMLDTVLRPKPRRTLRPEERVVRCRGTVVERQTTDTAITACRNARVPASPA